MRSVAQAEGGRADLDMYIYREGSTRAGPFAVALLLALLARALVPGATFAPGGLHSRPHDALLFFGVLCAAGGAAQLRTTIWRSCCWIRIVERSTKSSGSHHVFTRGIVYPSPFPISQASRPASLRQEVRASWMRSRRTACLARRISVLPSLCHTPSSSRTRQMAGSQKSRNCPAA